VQTGESSAQASSGLRTHKCAHARTKHESGHEPFAPELCHRAAFSRQHPGNSKVRQGRAGPDCTAIGAQLGNASSLALAVAALGQTGVFRSGVKTASIQSCSDSKLLLRKAKVLFLILFPFLISVLKDCRAAGRWQITKSPAVKANLRYTGRTAHTRCGRLCAPRSVHLFCLEAYVH